MKAMLPYAQKKAQLPEGFMSKEELGVAEKRLRLVTIFLDINVPFA